MQASWKISFEGKSGPEIVSEAPEPRFIIRLFAAVFFCAAGVFAFGGERPITGKAVAGFEPLDKAILGFMTDIHATAATVAVSKGGNLIYSRGFGWADKDKKKAVEPNALMRIASVTKPITRAIIQDMISAKKISLDDKAFSIISISPPDGKIADPRILEITIGQLLEHQGGWDRKEAFDPMFKTREIEEALHLNHPARPEDVVSYMLTKPLQFNPGEKTAYSNFGFCVLGRVIEAVMKKPYLECVQEHICRRYAIADIKPAHSETSQRDPREVWYPVADDYFSLDVMDSHGGLIASAPALCQFMRAYWLDGKPRLPNQDKSRVAFGSLSGTTAMAEQRSDGLNVAVLFNNRKKSGTEGDNMTLKKAVDDAMDLVLKKR